MSEATPAPIVSNAEPLVRKALAHLERNDLQQAESLLLQVLQAEPDHAGALELLGVIRRQQGDLPGAEQLYRRALAIDPEQAQVHQNLGSLLKILGRPDEAVAAYREAVRLKPHFAEAHLNLALTLSETGDHEAAEKSCRQALRIQPNYLLARQTLANELCELGRAGEAESLLRQALALGVRNPRQAAALEHNLAIALTRQRRFSEALPLFDAAQTRVPELPAVDYNRGSALQQLGQAEAAVRSYRRAVARDPLDIPAHEELNQLLYRMGEDASFLRSYDEAALLYPERGELLVEKGKFLYLRGEYAGARELFARACRLMPEDPSPHHGLAAVLTHLNELEAAIPEHELVLRMTPGRPQAWRNYAQALLAAGDADAALAAAERALAIEPQSQLALAIWSLALRVLGDPREERINDVESLVRVYEIPPPEGYSSIGDFNRELDDFLDGLHRDRREAIDQTLREGTQTLDNLFGMGHAPVEQLRLRIDEAVTDYVARMPDDAEHPLFGRRRNGFAYAASWSSRLRDCGYHTNHVHPKGWISSAYYIALPDAIERAGAQEGWIRFGEPNLPCGIADPVRRTIKPVSGALVLFPSYMWHGTVAFRSAQARTTIAFDAVPEPH